MVPELIGGVYCKTEIYAKNVADLFGREILTAGQTRDRRVRQHVSSTAELDSPRRLTSARRGYPGTLRLYELAAMGMSNSGIERARSVFSRSAKSWRRLS